MREECSLSQKKKTRRPRRKFTDEFKADVVKLCRNGTESIRAVAERLDLSETSVRAWVEQAKVDEGANSAKLRQKGEVVSPKTVATVMRNNGPAGRRKKKFRAATDGRHTQRIAPNVLKRDFTAERPDQVWVTDVTALWTHAGWCFQAAILDIFSRGVVGGAISESNDARLALSALQRALDHRKPAPGLLHDSDRGSPYGSDDYVAVLKHHDITRSVSRKGGLLGQRRRGELLRDPRARVRA